MEVINELPVAKNNIKVNSQGQLILKNINRRAEGIWECSVQSWTVHHRDPRKTYTTVIEFKRWFELLCTSDLKLYFTQNICSTKQD